MCGDGEIETMIRCGTMMMVANGRATRACVSALCPCVGDALWSLVADLYYRCGLRVIPLCIMGVRGEFRFGS